MALQELGQPAISSLAHRWELSLRQNTSARILHIQPERVERHLKDGKVIVVAGFRVLPVHLNLKYNARAVV